MERPWSKCRSAEPDPRGLTATNAPKVRPTEAPKTRLEKKGREGKRREEKRKEERVDGIVCTCEQHCGTSTQMCCREGQFVTTTTIATYTHTRVLMIEMHPGNIFTHVLHMRTAMRHEYANVLQRWPICISGNIAAVLTPDSEIESVYSAQIEFSNNATLDTDKHWHSQRPLGA